MSGKENYLYSRRVTFYGTPELLLPLQQGDCKMGNARSWVSY